MIMDDYEPKENYTFHYHSEVHGRTVEVSLSFDESVKNGEVIEEFCNFISAIYGYRIDLEKT